MTLEILKSTLLWSFVINMGLLLYWFLLVTFAHDWLYRLHTKWFSISREHFDAIHYMCMATYKVGIFLFFLIPYLALLISS